MYGKREFLTKADLDTLKENKVPEGKELEYKEKLPGGTDEEKKEFLADVTSFANTSGGHIIYGIKENEGVPENICGLGAINTDESVNRLGSMIRDGIKPRIPLIDIYPVIDKNNNSFAAIVVSIPKSWISPHIVTYGKSFRFFARHSNGKYQLDVSEIRQAFLLSETIADKIRGFRADRIAKVIGGITLDTIPEYGKLILSIIPFIAFESGFNIDLIENYGIMMQLPLISDGSKHEKRYNIDGVIHYIGKEDDTGSYRKYSYLQVFRSGIIELADDRFLRPYSRRFFINHEKFDKIIHRNNFDSKIVECSFNYIVFLRSINVPPPIVIYLSLLNMKGYVMPKLDEGGNPKSIDTDFDDITSIDRDNLLIPEILIDDYSVCENMMMFAKIIKPIIDTVWQACGLPGSRNYDEEGNYINDIGI